MILLVKYWKEAALVLLGIALFAMWRSRENGLVERGKAQERARVADSIIAVLRPRLAKADSAVLRGAISVTQIIERWRVDTAWRKDTVFVAGDTTPRIAVPVATVARQDSTNQKCSELAIDCSAFRLLANRTIAALETKLASQPIARPRSCTVPTLVGGLVGVGVGAVGIRYVF